MSGRTWQLFKMVNGEMVVDDLVSVDITTKEEAQELLNSYGPEVIRAMWENGAFPSPLPPEVKEYFVQLLLNPPKTD
jgi:hypothetical protein